MFEKLFETRHSYPSAKNGEVFVWRTLPWGRWQLGASGYGQTTHYTNAMWEYVTRAIAARGEPVQRVCIGGLGGAGHPHIIKKYFPDCHVTIVEHDPVVIRVVEQYGLLDAKTPSNHQGSSKWAQIIEGDLFEVLRSQVEGGARYDLVCIDLFTGEHPSTETCSPSAIKLLKSSLAPRGVLIVNVFKNREYLDALKPAFAHHTEVVFRANTLGIFWDHEER